MAIRNLPILIGILFIAGCGGGGNELGVSISRPPTAPTISTQSVFGNLSFNQPVGLLQAPRDSTRWFVVEKNGLVRVFANDQSAISTSTFLDLRGVINASGEGGLLGMAFDPDFPIVPEVYVSFTRSGSPLVSYI